VNSIHNYFAPGPSSSTSSAETPTPLFVTEAERCKRVRIIKQGKSHLVYAYFSAADGTLKGGCDNCDKNFTDILNFAPANGSSNTQGDHNKFVAAYTAYKNAYASGDREECVVQRAILVKLRNTRCISCRPAVGYLSPAARACKEWYDATRQAMATQHDGCQHPNCPERGAHVWQIIGADHGTNPKKRDANDKLVQLSDYAHWPGLGGVPAMIEESVQIQKWICHFCHRLEPTSTQGQKCTDPSTMPLGAPSGSDEEKKQYHRRWRALRIYPKQQYVDAAKRRVGCCAHCKRPVVAGQEQAFDWNHIDEATKCKGCLFGQQGGVSGLVQNHTSSATLEKVKNKLDTEIGKCNLLCCNCHARHTCGYEPSQTVY